MSKHLTHHTRNLSKQKGSALLNTMVAALFVSAAFVTLSDYVYRERAQVLKTTSLLNLRFGLNSTVDFMLYGLRQRWCFGPNLLPDTNCNLMHSANTLRLTMSNDEENFIRQLIASKVDVGPHAGIKNLSLARFERTVSFDSITTNHPLYPIALSLKSPSISGFYVSVSRDQGQNLPQAGNETFLNVTVELMDKNGKRPIRVGGVPLSMTSRVSVHRRELGSFALILPKDLYLDRGTSQGLPSKGDTAIPRTDSPGKLSFLSPVFVNENVHLPTSGYNPVTFVDRLVLGNGKIFRGEQPFSPETPGGKGSETWNDLSNVMGGIMNGIDIDGKPDRGLIYGWQKPPSDSDGASARLMFACIAHSQFLADRKLLEQTSLEGFLASRDQNDFTYRIGFYTSPLAKLNSFQSNEFSPQVISFDSRLNAQDWLGGRNDLVQLTHGQGRPIMRLGLTVGSHKVSASLTYDGSLNIQHDLRLQIQDRIKNLEAELKGSKEPNQGSKQGSKQGARQGPNQAPDQGPDPKVIEQELAALRNFAANYQPSAIRLEVASINPSGHVQPHVVNLKVQILNSQNLVQLGDFTSGKLEINPVSPEVAILGYDSTFYNGNPILKDEKWSNNQLPRYIVFERDSQNGSWLAPTRLFRSLSPRIAGASVSAQDFAYDWGKFNADCEALRNAQTGEAFGGASWNYDFSPKTRCSWNFGGNGAISLPPDFNCNTMNAVGDVEFNQNNSSEASPDRMFFFIRSIAPNCIVRASATLVTGFLVCDKFTIEARSTPLRIIGTVIAGDLAISPAALKAGITWSSIYHSSATPILRKAKILKTTNGQACAINPDPNNPIWHPIPSIQNAANRYYCNAISLRARSDNFQWTAVDPDCGIVGTASSTSCKRHPRNFLVIEYAREGGI